MAEPAVHLDRTGDAGPTVLFLHGSGATAAVWAPVLAELARRGRPVRALAVDLPGHGRSAPLPGYHHRFTAAAVASAVRAALPRPRIDLVVGHSLGGLVGLTLADGGHGLVVDAVTVMSMKVRWTEAELGRRAGLAGRAPRVFPEREAAERLFARVSGLDPDSGPALLGTGIREVPGGYGLAADPGLTADPPAGPEELAAAVERAERAGARIRLVCGGADPGIDPEDMAAVLGGPVRVLPEAGHNPHLELPPLVADVIESALATEPAPRT